MSRTNPVASRCPALPRRAREPPRDRKYRRGKGKQSRRKSVTKSPRYTGITDELKDHVFDIGYNQCDQYTTTVREISHHVGRTYKNGADVKIH